MKDIGKEKDALREHKELVAKLATNALDAKREEHSITFPFLDAIQELTETLLVLIDGRHIRGAFAVYRALFETVVNVCFILAMGKPIAERALRHARQKSIRDLERRVPFPDGEVTVKWSGADEVLAESDSQELLKEFSTKKGREDTKWTPENIEQRLQAIHKKFGKKVSVGLYFPGFLYRQSSEVIHGTFYGAVYTWGVTEPGRVKCAEDIGKSREESLYYLARFGSTILNSLVQAVSSEFGRDDVVRQANELKEKASQKENK